MFPRYLLTQSLSFSRQQTVCEALSFGCCPQPYSKDHHSQNVPRNCFFLGGEGGDTYSIKGQTSKIFLSISEILWEESNIKSGGKSLRACLQRSWQGWRSNFLSGSGALGISKSIFSRNFYLRREKSRPSNNLSACNPHIKLPQKDVQGDWNRILWYPILSLSTRYVYLGGGRQICN